jgi:hypothetical protein
VNGDVLEGQLKVPICLLKMGVAKAQVSDKISLEAGLIQVCDTSTEIRYLTAT